MYSIFDFIFNEKKFFDLIALDIVEGLDNNYYVVDINGLVSLWPIDQHLSEFENNIKKLFNEDFYFECSDSISDFDQYIIGSGNKNSKIHIFNHGFIYEDKIQWRSKFDIKCPDIYDIKIHEHKEYPKYLVKPNMGCKSSGIKLYNDILFKNKLIDSHFVEEFIPSKLINNHCYSIRVYMIINKTECYPVLYLQRICPKPIITDLRDGLLTSEERISYLSNATSDNKIFYQNNSDSLKEFVSKIKIYQ